MDRSRDSKRRKERHDETDDYRKERSYKKRRSKSRSPNNRRGDSRRKRRYSRSKSPTVPAKQDKRRDDAPKDIESKSELPPRKAKETDMLNTRTGGAYIPPARLRMMQAQITDKSSVAYQRLAWEALKKSIHGHINKINVGNIGIIIKELLKENIVRGRGLLCRSVVQAQAASPTFTNVYAALVAAVNSRFPNIGELLLKRLVIQFKRGFKRNDKPTCISSASFIAHLVNQRVAHEILALELLTLLVETPTDDSVEVAIAFLKECGQKLTEVSSKGVNAIFEMLRNILHEGQLDKRVQYMIEVMFQVWKDGFKDHPAVIEELELVPEEEQFTHLLMLDDATDSQDILNVFKFDDKYEENEQKYKGLCKEILGSDAESGEEDGSGESGSEESDEEEEEEKEKAVTIIDNTETNLVALRRTIYLTINSSLDFEECAHKLMKMQLKPGQEIELCHMFLDCCAEQRTYEKFYGLLAQRFCNINRIYIGPFEEIFKDSYSTAHRLDTNRLRNVSKFFAHLFFTDSISWEALECVKLNEEDTTSSSRIYIKILFQELAEYMGLKKLNDRLKDPTLQEAFSGIFPRDNPKNTRFSINFFTSIGLGGLTDELREHLKQMPKNVPPQITEIKLDSESDSSSSSSSSDSSSSSSSDSSSSDSEEEEKKKEKKKKKKSKQKTPEPEVTNKESDKSERWGHDGFYDTYGKDARRNDPRSERRDNGDNFRKPREDFRNDDRWRNNYEQRNGNERYNRYGREDRRERESEKTGRDLDNNRRDRRQSDDDKNNREDEGLSRKRDDRDRVREERNERRKEQDEPKRRDERVLNEEYSRKKNDKDDERRDAKYRDEDRRKNDNSRNIVESRNDRDSQRQNYRDERNEKDHDRERKGDSEYSRRKQDKNVDRLDSRFEDERKNDGENSQKDRNDKEFRNDKERYYEQNSRNKRDDNDLDRREDNKGKQDGDGDIRNRKGREKDEDRSKKVDEEKLNQRDGRNRNNDKDNNEEDSRNRHAKSKRDDESKRNSRNDDDRNKNRKQEESNDNDSRSQIDKYKKEKHSDVRARYKEDRDNNKKSSSSDEEDSKNRRRDNDKKTEKKKDASLKVSKNKKRDKEKRKKENKQDSDSDSDSSDESDKKKEKNIKRKRDKERQKDKENLKDNTDSDNSDDAQKDLGGRYWDSFDIENKKSDIKEKFEGRTPEKTEKHLERRRER